MSDQVEFCLIAERGILESQAVLLCESIRAFAGRYAQARITVLSPRAASRPSVQTQAQLTALGARYVELDLVSAVPEYGSSYRVLGLGWLARQSGPEVMVQLDTDTIFVDEPDLAVDGYFAAARPPDAVGMCTTGPGDARYALWSAMSRVNDVTMAQLPMVETTVDGLAVAASYNGGLIVAPRQSFVAIEQCFIRIVSADLRSYPDPASGMAIGAGNVSAKGFEMWGTSQAAISIAAARACMPVRILDDGHNVPLHLLDRYRGPSSRPAHIHYHWLFNSEEGIQTALAGRLQLPEDRCEWLRHRLPLALRTREAVGLFSPTIVSAPSAAGSSPACSVVMTCYNDFRFLRAAVDSVLQQEFRDLELIVVDDGSDDPTQLDWLETIDPRVQLLRNPENVGTAVSANRGIKVARSDIIARLDSDDIAEPTRIGKLVAALRADPQLGLVGSDVTFIDEDGRVVGTQSMPESDFEIRWTLLFHNPFYHSAVAFRRSCFEAAGGYRPDEPVSQDHYLWFDMLPFCRARSLPERLTRYRLNSAGLTATHAGNDPRRRTDPIRTALWREIGLFYNSEDLQRASDMSELLRGKVSHDNVRRARALETIQSTFNRVFSLRNDFMRDGDEAAAEQVAAKLGRQFVMGRARGGLVKRGWNVMRTRGLRTALSAAWRKLGGNQVKRPQAPVAASSQAADWQADNPVAALLHDISPYAGFDAEAITADAQGWGSTAPILGQVIEALRPKLIVEVGSWKGASAIHMAERVEALKLDTRIICVDTWLGSPEHFLGQRPAWRESLRLHHGYPSLYYTFLANVVRAGQQNRIIPLANSSDNAAVILRARGITADLVYVDGAHEEAAVYRDLCNYWSLLASDGVLIGDDYDWEDVKRAADRFAAEVGRPIESANGKFVIRRMAC